MLVGVLRVDDVDQAAGVHDGDPVGQVEDLVQLEGDQQDGLAAVTLLDKLLVDELDRSDVQSPGRLYGDQQIRVGLDLAADDRLLLVSSGQLMIFCPYSTMASWLRIPCFEYGCL